MPAPLDPSSNPGDTRADESRDGHFENSQRTGADLRAARDAITGGGDPVYFGPERQAARIAAREDELRRIREQPLAEPPPGMPIFIGGEHEVWVVGEPVSQVFKRTLPGGFGMILDEKVLLNPRTFQNHRQLAPRPALPSEYLRRWQALHRLFGLPTAFAGQVMMASQEVSFTVMQPYVPQDERDPPTVQDVVAFMEAYDFVPVPVRHLVEPQTHGTTWYRQKDGILISDAFPRNFRKHRMTHALVPIDLVVTWVPQGSSRLLPAPEEPWADISGD